MNATASQPSPPDEPGDASNSPRDGLPPSGNALPHEPHPDCLVTPAFRNQVDSAAVAVVVVNAEGFFIYGNAAAEALLGYPMPELCRKHIFDVATAESTRVAEEFAYLQQCQTWSGRVRLQRMTGDFVGVSVNAFSSRLPSDSPEFFALLHAMAQEGTDLARLAGPPTLALTPRDISLLQLIADGFADKEIANILATSVWTINKDVSEMLGKLGASSRTSACVKAFRQGVIV